MIVTALLEVLLDPAARERGDVDHERVEDHAFQRIGQFVGRARGLGGGGDRERVEVLSALAVNRVLHGLVNGESPPVGGGELRVALAALLVLPAGAAGARIVAASLRVLVEQGLEVRRVGGSASRWAVARRRACERLDGPAGVGQQDRCEIERGNVVAPAVIAASTAASAAAASPSVSALTARTCCATGAELAPRPVDRVGERVDRLAGAGSGGGEEVAERGAHRAVVGGSVQPVGRPRFGDVVTSGRAGGDPGEVGVDETAQFGHAAVVQTVPPTELIDPAALVPRAW